MIPLRISPLKRASILFFSTAMMLTPSHGKSEYQRYQIEGLQQEGEILIDEWGVPHIYAQSEHDAFFLQGFNAARDRLWQMELWRRKGLGTLSEVFGPRYRENDLGARYFLYRSDMSEEWRAYGPTAKRSVTAFVDGVNAFIKLTRSHPALLPPEYPAVGFAPSLWKPEDIVRIRGHYSGDNISSEVTRARTLCQHGIRAESYRKKLEPPHTLYIPPDVDFCAIPDDVLHLFNAAYSYPFPPLSKDAPGAVDAADDSGDEGSNLWAIAPSRSSTGRPVLASDPHLYHQMPSNRIIVHLNAPGMNIIGAGNPATPALALGHNGSMAFGLTTFQIDQSDLMVYELHPTDDDKYRYMGRWRQFDAISETLDVLGQAAEAVHLKFSTHGPVIYVDDENRRAYAVRSAQLLPGAAPIMTSLTLMRATGWEEFRDALTLWGSPGLNMIYAGKDGHIGWVAAGYSPNRTRSDGLLPVPGDGRFEWRDIEPISRRMSLLSPERGWIASANNMAIPADCRAPECFVGYEWIHSTRYDRIAAFLSGDDKIDFETSLRMQQDTLSAPAVLMRDVLKSIASDKKNGRALKAAVDLLSPWNARMEAHSPAAALFEWWWYRRLNPALYDMLVGPPSPGERRFLIDHPHMMEILSMPSHDIYERAGVSRDELVIDTLLEAYGDLKEEAGADPSNWAWGKFHQLKLQPALAATDEASKGTQSSCPPLSGDGVDGSNMTLNLAAHLGGKGFKPEIGPTVRMVIDVGAWDNSRGMNMPGQSGDPRSPHYCDLYESWKTGEMFPLLYSEDKVRAAAVKTIVLRPTQDE